MEILISSIKINQAPIWKHFLLKSFSIKCVCTDMNNAVTTLFAELILDNYVLKITDTIKYIELNINSDYIYQGQTFNLLKIVQTLEIKRENNGEFKLIPVRWIKSPNSNYKINKAVPATHPLLKIDLNNVILNVLFLDISYLFTKIHGNTPWFQSLGLLRKTNRTILVLASLKGHPFIWYVIIPETIFSENNIQPNVLLYPADYGGIYYDSQSIHGITSSNHSISVGNIQCGGETLFSFLTSPLSDSDYFSKLENYIAISKNFKKFKGRNPPPLHHFRKLINYNIENGKLIPKYWDIPFGFEEAISQRKNMLIIPQINGGDGGTIIRENLKEMIENLVMTAYTGGSTLTYESISINNLILTAYSESGGNIFTAAYKNIKDIRALILFEPQYMNTHLGSENRNLILGKQVIPLLLKNGVKIAIVGRHKKGWENKYIPNGVPQKDLILIPIDTEYFNLDYPNPNIQYDPNKSPVLKYRYSRLLDSKKDVVTVSLISGNAGDIDVDSAIKEEKIEKVIDQYRSKGLNDEQLTKLVFTLDYNADSSGGYYTHNFIVSCGQLNKTFFHEALEKIG